MANLLKTIIFLAIVGAIAMVVAQMYFGNFLNPQGGFFVSLDQGTTWKKLVRWLQLALV